MDRSEFSIIETKYVDSGSILFIRVKVNDLSKVVAYILNVFTDISWLNGISEDFLRVSIEACTKSTVEALTKQLRYSDGDTISKEVGEYVVSELSRESITTSFGKYSKIPLAEFYKQKTTGNPGFDLHTENIENKIILFGEAKFVGRQNGYTRAFKQIVRFENEKNDIKDLKDLMPFCSKEALNKVLCGEKGFIAAFSCTAIKTEKLLKNILTNEDLKKIKTFSETICVAVEI